MADSGGCHSKKTKQGINLLGTVLLPAYLTPLLLLIHNAICFFFVNDLAY